MSGSPSFQHRELTIPSSQTKYHEYICNDCGKVTRLCKKDQIKCSHCIKSKILFKPRCQYTLQYEAR